MFFAHRDVQFVIRIYFVFDDRYFGSFHYTAHEQDACNHQAYFDGDSQVEDDGEEKSDKQYCYIRFGIFQ